jgi:hypothetical protein
MTIKIVLFAWLSDDDQNNKEWNPQVNSEDSAGNLDNFKLYYSIVLVATPL